MVISIPSIYFGKLIFHFGPIQQETSNEIARIRRVWSLSFYGGWDYAIKTTHDAPAALNVENIVKR